MKVCLQAIKIAICALLGGAAAAHASSSTVTIPAGTFLRGDSVDHNTSSDAPTNWVYVSSFQIESNLVTYALWTSVYQWAINHGYSFNNVGAGFGANHPVQSVSWFDAVKWCNARSQMEGFTPCYYTDASLATVYTTGTTSLKTNFVSWAANGYRLPTEAEWEKAARGGLTANRFPWGATVSHSQASYKSPLVLFSYDVGPPSVFPIATSPVGSYPPNGFGLFDMAGNVEEWCWDYYTNKYYASGPRTDPQGPAGGSTRVTRGGGWSDYANVARCAMRVYASPSLSRTMIGFRCVQAGNGSSSPGQQSQKISFNMGATLTSGSTNQLLATSDSGLPVSFSIVGSTIAPLILNGNGTFLSVNLSTVTIAAHVDAGTANSITYSSADTNVTFTVIPAGGTPALSSKTLAEVLGGPTNIVDQQSLNTVLAHYWSQSPPYITNATFPDRTNLCFGITNFAFTVQYSTNLSTWQNLDAEAKIVFTDANAASAANYYYRLVGSTNYPNQ